jgi:hypothetical protein
MNFIKGYGVQKIKEKNENNTFSDIYRFFTSTPSFETLVKDNSIVLL